MTNTIKKVTNIAGCDPSEAKEVSIKMFLLGELQNFHGKLSVGHHVVNIHNSTWE